MWLGTTHRRVVLKGVGEPVSDRLSGHGSFSIRMLRMRLCGAWRVVFWSEAYLCQISTGRT